MVSVPDFSRARVLVVGDVMLDRYWYGQASRISPEAPVPVMRVERTEERPGGAGNVALNIASLGAQVTLLGIVGKDEAALKLESILQAKGIQSLLVRCHDRPTITKLRALSHHQQLIRLDFEEHFFENHAKEMLEKFEELIQTHDIVILSDYGKGTLSNALAFIKLARMQNKPIFIDPKSNDFSIYHGATLITPNYKEFETVVGICQNEEDVMRRALALLSAHDIASLLITRGEQGMTLFQEHSDQGTHLTSQAREVFDVTGAGDTVIATLAAAFAAGLSMEDAMHLANLAAGLVVAKLGAATISPHELRRAANNFHVGGILTEEQLIEAVAEAHAHKETVVMTNGCFDILHPGHIHYLEQAKKLGERLIVAVNSDLSVARLKGKNRPINSLEKRMSVLAGLSAVDWVVPFSEDTPERLICKILPDILVKGGDWKPEEIAGGECVLKNGGKVMSLDFVEGHSTTKVIDRINQLEED